jgi:hypothetical protein
MLFKKIGILFFGLISILPLYGVFYNVQEWSNGKNTLYLFSDYHEPTISIATNQRYDLACAAKKIGAFVIVEDMLNPYELMYLDKETDLSCQKFLNGDKQVTPTVAPALRQLFCAIRGDLYSSPELSIPNLSFNPNANYSHLLPSAYLTEGNKDMTPLAFLSLFCQKLEVPVADIEYRFFHGNESAPLESAIAMLEKGISELRSYNDETTLNAYYASIYDNPFFQEILSLLKSIHVQYPTLSFSEFLETDTVYSTIVDNLWDRMFEYTVAQRVECEKFLQTNPLKAKKHQLIVYGMDCVLDARIMHAIFCHKQFENIFVCCGGMHIEGLERLLPQLGFALISTKGKEHAAMVASPDYAIHIEKIF